MKKISSKFFSLTGKSIILLMFSITKVYAAPVSQHSPLLQWSGFYAGVNAGINFNHAKVRAHHIGFTDPNENCDVSSNFSSFFSGIQLGYNKQFQSNLILGIEGSLTDNFDQTKTLKCDCDFNNIVTDQFKVKTRGQGSIRGRIGYIYDQSNFNLLPFVTAGVSVADLGLSYSNEAGDYYSTHSTTSGWLAGLGIEWAFLKKWSLRAEYIYADYGNAEKLNIPTIYGLTDPNGKSKLNFNTSYIAIALNYWFDN